MIALALFLATCFLAYFNGANDNFKGVASLDGSKTTNYRTANTWTPFTIFACSITAAFFLQALRKKCLWQTPGAGGDRGLSSFCSRW